MWVEELKHSFQQLLMNDQHTKFIYGNSFETFNKDTELFVCYSSMI